MVKRDGAEVRRERIQGIAKRVMISLHKSSGEISLRKTMSILAFEFGLTETRILEYLSILEDLDRFRLDIQNDKIRKITEEAGSE